MEQSKCKRDLARRQQCACLIQEIGSRLQTTQVVINAGIFYMHYFYEVFSPETIKPILVAIAAFYCACKTEDFSRKLSLLIKAAYDILKRPAPSEGSDTFKRLVQNIHALEATILMVIGFHTLEVKQPHVLLIKAIRANKFPKEIAHTSYYICTNILHLTTLILNHSVEAIAAASLYIAAKWNGTDIQSSNGEWYHIFSPSLTFEEVAKITEEFTLTFQECDLKIKEQLRNSLRSRKLQRERREEPVNSTTRSQEPIRRVGPESTQPPKTDSWKSEKRPYSGTNVPSLPPPHVNHHVRSHNNAQSGSINHPYHGPNRPVPPHPYVGGEHVNRPHASRAQTSMNEPEPKRQRFDRSFSSQNRHSPQTTSYHSDATGRVNRHDNPTLHPGYGAAGRMHSTDYRMVASGTYSSVQNKPYGRDDHGETRQNSGINRPVNKSGVTANTTTQANNRPIAAKPDLNDYF